MSTIKRALQSFLLHLVERKIDLFMDSQVVQAILTKITSLASLFMQGLCKIFYLFAVNCANVGPQWIPTSTNTFAYALSH